jgi:hypothetical protein
MARYEERYMIANFVLWLMCLGILSVAAPAGAQSGSNASNYQSGAQLSVNGRTGDVTVAVTLVRLPGIVSEMDLGLAMTYRSEDARSNIQSNIRHFGLPYGWSLGLSFIYNEGSAIKLNVDGTQVYQLDSNWRSLFTPIGASAPLSAKTGLMQYNRADAHLKSDTGSVTVNGLGSAYIFTNLAGQVKYFSPGGLMIREADRFGSHIDYHYLNSVTGGNAGNSTTAANATLSAMIDRMAACLSSRAIKRTSSSKSDKAGSVQIILKPMSEPVPALLHDDVSFLLQPLSRPPQGAGESVSPE